MPPQSASKVQVPHALNGASKLQVGGIGGAGGGGDEHS